MTTSPAAAITTATGTHTQDRFACFNGLRAIAALSVLVHHVAGATGAVTGTFTGYAYAHFDAGVSVFFLLSGFLLYRPWALAHLDPIGARPSPVLRTYARRRLVRILPAYWVALTVFLLIGTISVAGPRDSLAYYGLAQVYAKGRALGGIPPAWSLSVELSFYAFLPLFAGCVGRMVGAARARTWRSPVQVEGAAVAAMFVVGTATHAAILHFVADPYPASLWLPAQLGLFALGMGLAVASAQAESTGRPTPILAAAGRHPAWCWAGAGATFAVASLGIGLSRVPLASMTHRQEILRQLLYGLLALLLLIPAVAAPDADRPEGRIRGFLASPPMTALGTVSYGIFLWHFPWLVQLTRVWHLDRHAGALRFPVVLAATAALGIASGAASWFLVERPLLRYSVRIPSGRGRPNGGL